MVHYLVICRSLTYAQRTSKILDRAGINGQVARTPKMIAKDGCGYCVRIGESKLAAALLALRKENMSPKQIYILREDGSCTEVES